MNTVQVPKHAEDALRSYEKQVSLLMQSGRIPDKGWSELWIRQWLGWLASMDCNNTAAVCGVGEREGRVFSRLVAERHFGLAHGIGRSGSLLDSQPKAAGSSLLQVTVQRMVKHALSIAGIQANVMTGGCLVVPMATGMTLALCLRALAQDRPQARYVLWSRIDQKSGLKAIKAAGFTPIVIPLALKGDELQVDLQAVREKIQELGSDRIVAYLSTTSCFAPRVPDPLAKIKAICEGIPILVNNAYGLQSRHCVNLINAAAQVDLIVQSTDKNFMVPVGGAIVTGPRTEILGRVSSLYAGRASATPLIDLAITLLEMGVAGYSRLLAQQRENFVMFKASLQGMRVFNTPRNDISIAVGLGDGGNDLGSKLFYRQVSGCRVIADPTDQVVEGILFKRWGSHHDEPYEAYFNVAAAIGQSPAEIDRFVEKLHKLLGKG